METFGARLRELRNAAHIGLREFCEKVRMEPSNYSRLERDITPAPQDHGKLEPIREALSLEPQSSVWIDLLRLADLSRGALPRRVMTDAEVMNKMPALMRRLDGEPMTDEQVEELVALVRRAHEPDQD